MELTNTFTVPLPVAEAWRVLTDIERIAPCLPGAQLQEIDGNEYRGVVKVKIGPITAQYRGVARIHEQDQAAGRIVLVAEGRDVRGSGNASATVTATLVGNNGATDVMVVTDLTIAGKIAQFGRGVLNDVSTKLLGQFVTNLEATVLTTDQSASTPPMPAAGPIADEPVGPRPIASPEPAAVDLFTAAGAAVLKRVAPAAIAGLVAVVLLYAFRQRGGARSR